MKIKYQSKDRSKQNHIFSIFGKLSRTKEAGDTKDSWLHVLVMQKGRKEHYAMTVISSQNGVSDNALGLCQKITIAKCT